MDGYFEELLQYINGLEIIDTHEHLPYIEDERDRQTDILKEYLLHYFCRDLISAGLKPYNLQKVTDTRLPLMERWDLVEPYWEACRNTGYGRSLDIAAKGIYGIDGINRTTLEALNESFIKCLKPGHFHKVLKEKSKIRLSLLDYGRSIEFNLAYDKTLFRRVYRLDNFIFPQNGITIRGVEARTGIKVRSLDDWLDACETSIDRALNSGVVAFKCGLAYNRPLKFERVGKQEAENDFNDILRNLVALDIIPYPFKAGKSLQDYMMHHILKLADRRNLVYQFHTGYFEGNSNIISNGDPSLMNNLFLEYPGVDFDIFHIGYPHHHKLASLAKMFPNVYIDMCWAHIMSPSACIAALADFLDAVPANKISAFGGDYLFVDGVYGNQFITRRNVAHTLAAKVRDGDMEMGRAKEIASMLFYSNPVRIFRLEQAVRQESDKPAPNN